jgi:hypothetical protein
MNTWQILLIVWLVIDFARYICYQITYHKLNCIKNIHEVNDKNIKKIISDLKTFPELLEDNIRDIFYSRVRLEDMNFADVCHALHSLICQEDPRYIADIKYVLKNLQTYEKGKNNRIIFKDERCHHRINDGQNDIKSWFTILPIFIVTRGFGLIIQLYLKYLKYRSLVTDHGIKIWYTDFDKLKGPPLVFFHASVGGVSLQCTLLKYYHKNHNVIMPEIPGVSFIDTMEPPPSLNQIVDTVYQFIVHHYVRDNGLSGNSGSCPYTDVPGAQDSGIPGTGPEAPGIPGTGLEAPGIPGTGLKAPGIPGTGSEAPGIPGTGPEAPGIPGTGLKAPGIPGTGPEAPGMPGTGPEAPGTLVTEPDNMIKINLMGHSLGNTMCAGFINRYPKIVDNFFCIEGHIFFNRGLRIYTDFESHFRDLAQEDLVSVPLLHRSLCVQFFMHKCLTVDTAFIYDLADPDNKHIKIHMFHIKSDRILQIKPQLDYAVKKSIPVSYHIFDANYSHGSFIMNHTVKKYVITKIQEIYEQQYQTKQ